MNVWGNMNARYWHHFQRPESMFRYFVNQTFQLIHWWRHKNVWWCHMNVKKLKTVFWDQSQCSGILLIKHFSLYIDDVTQMYYDITLSVDIDDVTRMCNLTWMFRNLKPFSETRVNVQVFHIWLMTSHVCLMS